MKTNNNEIDKLKKRILELENNELENQLQSTKVLANTFFNLSINLQLIANVNGEVLQVSNNCKNILGYTQEELVNTSFLDLVHPDDREPTIEEMKQLQIGKHVYYFENRYKHKDEHYVVLGWSADVNEDKTIIYASAHDKTRLKKNEQLVLQQSKMASMGEMLENIAHQWRQPLSVISTLSSSLDVKNDLGLLDKDEISSSVKNIDLNVQHLSSTIDTFRNFYKSNKINKTFKVKEALDTTFKLASSQFHKAEITIIEEILDIRYTGLENELIQVIMNILNNARDELIKLKGTRLLLINVSIKDDYVEIDIIDNAGGIPEDILPNVFEAHFTTKTDTTGTGIGLYMSKTIIEEHMNGRILAENIDFSYNGISYIGARFSIVLPLTK